MRFHSLGRLVAFGLLGLSTAVAQVPDADKADALWQKQDYAGAAAAYEAIAKADPKNGLAWRRLGYALHTLGKLDEALAAHQRSTEFPEHAALGWYNAACVHSLKGKADEAVAALEKSIKAGFHNVGALDNDEDLKLVRADQRFAALRERAVAAQREAGSKRRKVAVIVHPGVELLDFAGPAEVFSGVSVSGADAFEVFTVGPVSGPIETGQGVRVIPTHTFADCPKPDIIVIPGGATQRLTSDTRAMEWIRKSVPQTEVTLTVCTGAFALAELGMLDGLKATTHFSAIPGLQREFTKVDVRKGARFCDNGRIVTTAGISAGIDGALHVVSRLCGIEAARDTARGMEYDWKQLGEQVTPR